MIKLKKKGQKKPKNTKKPSCADLGDPTCSGLLKNQARGLEVGPDAWALFIFLKGV
jgi:hypothetical protein